MINELYTLLNNAPYQAGLLAQDVIDADFRPLDMGAQVSDLLGMLIGRGAQNKQYWLTLIRGALCDRRFWQEPLEYFDPRGGYALEDLAGELHDYRRLQVTEGLRVESSQPYWLATTYELVTWQLLIEGGNATLWLRQGETLGKSVTQSFSGSGMTGFLLEPELRLVVYNQGSAGTIRWATSPTLLLVDRVHAVQSQPGNLHFLAKTEDSRFPAALRSGLLDLALCRLDVYRAAAAMLLLAAGHLGKRYDASN